MEDEYMVHEYIQRMISDLESQMKKNQDDINNLMVANSELQRIVNELRTLK